MVQFLFATTHGVVATLLRGGTAVEEQAIRPQDPFAMADKEEAFNLTTLHRDLQKKFSGGTASSRTGTGVSLPLWFWLVLFIILLIICIACGLLKKKEELTAEKRAAAKAGSTVVVNDSEPKLVTAAATKPSPHSSTGVGFVRNTDYAKISRITDDSIFKETALTPGMKVVSINNRRVNSGDHAVQVIKETPSTVTILAHAAGYFGSTESFVTATARKEYPDQVVGVIYLSKKDKHSENTGLKHIAETSLFAGSDLAPGMEVVAINNVKVRSAIHAQTLTMESFPFVTILARCDTAVAMAINPSSDEPAAPATVLGGEIALGEITL